MKIVIIHHYEQGCGLSVNIVSKYDEKFLDEIEDYFMIGAYVYDVDVFIKDNKKEVKKSLSQEEKIEFKYAKQILKEFIPRSYKYLKSGYKFEINFKTNINLS